MKTIVWFGFVLSALSATGEVLLTEPGLTVTIKCGISQNDIGLTWFREGIKIVGIQPKTGMLHKGQGDIVKRSSMRWTELQITSVKEGDAGKITCAHGVKTEEHTLIVVSVSATPSGTPELGSAVTLHCKVKGLNPEPAVQWSRPNTGTVSNPFEIKSVSDSDAGNWTCTFVHDGKTLTQNLNIIVKDPPPRTSTTVPPKRSNDTNKPGVSTFPASAAPDQELHWWMWVAIASGCLVVILLTVLVTVMCKRVRRRKARFQRMKKSSQLMQPKEYCQCNRRAAAPKPQQGRRGEKPSAPPLPLVMERHERQIEERRVRQKERSRASVRGGEREEQI